MSNVELASGERFSAQHGKENGNLTPAKSAPLERLESWVANNSTWIAIVIIAVAFALRIYYAVSAYLNPDEAVHFLAARPHTWHGAYKASRLLSDPPLFVMLLHWTMQIFGRTELALRLPSVLASTAALWITFAWLRRILGALPALAGLIFFTVSQSAITAGTEARPYGLLLFFVCGALYATERAFSDRSAGWAIAQGLMLIGAALTHYTSVVVIPALGLYALVRSYVDRVPRPVWIAFIADQLAIASVIGYLYFHLVLTSPSFTPEGRAYLAPAFWRKGHETFLEYVWLCVHRTFTYFTGFGNDWSHPIATFYHPIATFFCIVFLAGLLALLIGRAGTIAGTVKDSRLLAALIVFTFVMGFIESLMKMFPFAGTREQAYLVPFFAAGLAAALKWIPRGFAPPVLALGVAFAAIWATVITADNDPRIYHIRDMRAAVNYIKENVPACAPLFVDEQTRMELSYYLGRDDASLDSFDRHLDNDQVLNGHRIISPAENTWMFDLNQPLAPLALVNQSAQAAGVPSGTSIWITSLQYPKPTPLASALPPGTSSNARAWGGISVIEAVHK
jgi:4-amino-4-deoxy-L-arabinose transferase-like glycosyltransferase